MKRLASVRNGGVISSDSYTAVGCLLIIRATLRLVLPITIMAVDVKSELRTIAKVHRWAYEEWTYAICMLQANRMDGRPNEQIAYLISRFGSAMQLFRETIKECKALKLIPPSEGSPKDKMRTVLRCYPWVLDELTVTQKEEEAVELFVSLQRMYSFMLYEFHNTLSVWENLKWLILVQRERRKTIHLFVN